MTERTVLAPQWWNELPTDIRAAESLYIFRRKLKTSFRTLSGLKHRFALQWHLNGSYLWYFCSSTMLRKCYFLYSCCS